jgi:hypothetical protein
MVPGDDEGGDPACWLVEVCDVCGRMRTEPDHDRSCAGPGPGPELPGLES